VITKSVWTSPLPVRTGPEPIPTPSTLAAYPQAVQVLESTRSRAAKRRDEAGTRGTRILKTTSLRRLVVCVAARGEGLIGGWV
jgi:hypothetical protein